MKKGIKWILIFLGAAIISHHPLQIFYAVVALLIITGIAAMMKFLIPLRRGNAN